MRSNYQNVAVVPVAVKERDRARGGVPEGAPVIGKTSGNDLVREKMEGFELLTDERPVLARRDLEDAAHGKSPAPQVLPRVNVRVGCRQRPRLVCKDCGCYAVEGGAAATTATTRLRLLRLAATGKHTGKRVVARRRATAAACRPDGSSPGVGGSEVLESTLEILSASTLSLEQGGRALISDGAARKDAGKSAGRFSKLLGRLSRTDAAFAEQFLEAFARAASTCCCRSLEHAGHGIVVVAEVRAFLVADFLQRLFTALLVRAWIEKSAQAELCRSAPHWRQRSLRPNGSSSRRAMCRISSNRSHAARRCSRNGRSSAPVCGRLVRGHRGGVPQ